MAKILAAGIPFVEANLAQYVSWSDSLRKAVRSGRELLQLLGLPVELADPDSERDFPVFAPLEYIRRMQTGDPHDPLLLQVLGSQSENAEANGTTDPVGDRAAEILPGLLQKYRRRVLLIASGTCAVHCRYCFRRHFSYDQAPKGKVGWQATLEAIQQDNSLDEVILSGGDPLTLADSTLAWLVGSLDNIGHLKRIRIHTRFPVVIPQRVCQPLLRWIAEARCAIYLVLHFNHVAEIDSEVEVALGQLRSAGATLLNQSVLLRGVNDSFEAQRDLCLRLADLQVLPYYLHQLDRVRGAMHFEVSDSLALDIVRQLRHELPGYAVPQLVREIAGQPHKMPV